MILLFCLLAVSCSENRVIRESGEEEALERATELVSKLNRSIKTEYTLTPAVWSGVPVVSITVEDAASDYMPTVESILKAVSSFEGALQVAVQTPMKPTDAEKASGVKDGKFILAHFDAKTGVRIPYRRDDCAVFIQLRRRYERSSSALERVRYAAACGRAGLGIESGPDAMKSARLHHRGEKSSRSYRRVALCQGKGIKLSEEERQRSSQSTGRCCFLCCCPDCSPDV